ncbi:hypothetical protein ACFUNF_18315 [Streptomyces sp. NPDC057291]|uniref:hypothetical protein n=1 Tax=Streptomyces sp. NPDC057291 TaxID=3346087 RepID=UPI00363737F2
MCRPGIRRTGTARRQAASGPETARKQVRESPTRNVTLDELSAITGSSKYRPVRVCRAWPGLSPHELHRLLWLERPRELLRRGRGSPRSSYETGFHVEFCDDAYVLPAIDRTVSFFDRII